MKRFLPVFWFVTFLATTIPISFTFGDSIESRLIIGVSLLLYTFYIADLADEVLDNGDHLIFRKGPLKQTIELRDIINIRRTRATRNDKVILTVQTTGPIGNKLAFLAEPRISSFTEHPIITELRQRVEAAQK